MSCISSTLQEFTHQLENQPANLIQIYQLLYGYQISRTQNFIVFTSYKSSFPQVSIDNQETPFLIEELIENKK
ncbi:unnamed protein product [Paramecium pentaurelia]|uniref:Uncharacterized protein n=1 Tax=Paramecium pentaurelia TaxID=43138 RepID=A0A8S1UUL1_9CILI|nr:unnamed protein product [Paramecium pentaurelia]